MKILTDKETELISSKIQELKRCWSELSEEERRKKLYGLHLMLAASDELLQEAALSDIVPDLETETEYRAGLQDSRETLIKQGVLSDNGEQANGQGQGAEPASQAGIDKWPSPVAEDAYCGLAGGIVRTISPYSEADDVALLVNLLVAFGNVIGRNPHFIAGADKHFTNLDGRTSFRKTRSRGYYFW